MNVYEQMINQSIKWLSEDKLIEVKNISDWFHSFWELYEHRTILFICLCKAMVWINKFDMIKSKRHNDWSIYEWFFIVQIQTEYWQISYHLENKYWNSLDFMEEQDKANEWDWHTSENVLLRLIKLFDL